MAATAFRADDPDRVVDALRARLPFTWEVCEIDGRVLVEADRVERVAIRAAVARALARAYGDDWKRHVDGFED